MGTFELEERLSDCRPVGGGGCTVSDELRLGRRRPGERSCACAAWVASSPSRSSKHPLLPPRVRALSCRFPASLYRWRRPLTRSLLLGPPSRSPLSSRVAVTGAARLFSTNRETLPDPPPPPFPFEFYDDDGDDLGPINDNDDVRLRCND